MKSCVIFLLVFCPFLVFSQKVTLPNSAFKPVIKVGSVSPDISSFMTDGTRFLLDSIKEYKKLILIDFWASWCIPCRAELPNLRTVYRSFYKEGFEIVSVSLDFKKENWLNAIKKDSMTWVNVSELRGRNESAASVYKVNALPASILIDSSGKILAMDLPGSSIPSNPGSLRGEELYRKVQALIGKENR